MSYLWCLSDSKQAATSTLTNPDLYDDLGKHILFFVVRKLIADLHSESHHYSLDDSDLICCITWKDQCMQLFNHGFVFI